MNVAIKFTEDDKNKLLQNPMNNYLTKPPEERYDEFKEHDPFPSIPDSLLNSYDIVRYVYTTGMINPFYPESLEGALYTCNFSGYYKYWDEKHKPQEGTLDESGELKLRPNSISFLEIEPIFRIPAYLVLRFNLKVQHVYKGLLLGTGPIVDPCFIGKLYIPLHNLTSNEYIIKKNAPLICVEFTKLSIHNDRKLTKKQELIIKDLDFSNVPLNVNSFEPSRDIEKYITKSLTNKLFRKIRTDEISVGSSIPEVILEARVNAGKSEENARNAEESAMKAEKNVNRFGLIAFCGILLTIGGLGFTIYSLIVGINARIDNIFSQYNGIKQENIHIQNENKELKDLIDNLQSIINNMQHPDKDNKAVSESAENKSQ
jgi:deoxycytidine triphosphate deaminase